VSLEEAQNWTRVEGVQAMPEHPLRLLGKMGDAIITAAGHEMKAAQCKEGELFSQSLRLDGVVASVRSLCPGDVPFQETDFSSQLPNKPPAKFQPHSSVHLRRNDPEE
jgi:hypothetical protein